MPGGSDEILGGLEPVGALGGQRRDALRDVAVLQQVEGRLPLQVVRGSAAHPAQTVRHVAQHVRDVRQSSRHDPWTDR